ncbi:hypothetical protein BaRGS_00017074 [Batillaria attramentaria]|uniref:Uncharacterized protein n=1 Tax=Batillaria attramentaria TaxID=370345 RepID=A0ABD0KWC8_9CAEN
MCRRSDRLKHTNLINKQANTVTKEQRLAEEQLQSLGGPGDQTLLSTGSDDMKKTRGGHPQGTLHSRIKMASSEEELEDTEVSTADPAASFTRDFQFTQPCETTPTAFAGGMWYPGVVEELFPLPWQQ